MIVNFAPQTLEEEVRQNIACIMETVAGSVPLDRSFGLDSTIVDLPMNIVQSQMTNRIIAAIQAYEPRIIVNEVRFQTMNDHAVKPLVKYSIVGG